MGNPSCAAELTLWRMQCAFQLSSLLHSPASPNRAALVPIGHAMGMCGRSREAEVDLDTWQSMSGNRDHLQGTALSFTCCYQPSNWNCQAAEIIWIAAVYRLPTRWAVLLLRQTSYKYVIINEFPFQRLYNEKPQLSTHLYFLRFDPQGIAHPLSMTLWSSIWMVRILIAVCNFNKYNVYNLEKLTKWAFYLIV